MWGLIFDKYCLIPSISIILLNTSCIAWVELNSEDNNILRMLKSVTGLYEGTVYILACMFM